MPKLFACLCNQPEKVLHALAPIREILSAPAQSIARWGVGYVQSGQVLISRSPRTVVTEFDFFANLGNLQSDYVIGYATEADGLSGNANTQPFRHKQWFFAQESKVTYGGELLRKMGTLLPGRLGGQMGGRSLAEAVFYLLLGAIDDVGQFETFNPDTSLMQRALRERLAEILDAIPKEDQSGFGNFILSNSRLMFVGRLGGPLFLRRTRTLEDPKRPDTESKSVVVVAAASAPQEGFEELAPGALLTIGREVTTDITALFSNSE